MTFCVIPGLLTSAYVAFGCTRHRIEMYGKFKPSIKGLYTPPWGRLSRFHRSGDPHGAFRLLNRRVCRSHPLRALDTSRPPVFSRLMIRSTRPPPPLEIPPMLGGCVVCTCDFRPMRNGRHESIPTRDRATIPYAIATSTS